MNRTSTSTSAAGLPAIGLLVSLNAWLPLGLLGPLLAIDEAPLGPRLAAGVALVAWWWIQGRVGRALTVLDRPVVPVLVQRIWVGLAIAGLLAVALAMLVHSGLLVLTAIPIWIVMSMSPLVLVLAARRPSVHAHLATSLRGEAAYYGRDRALAQVGVAMIFVHGFALALKIPLMMLPIVMGLVAIDVALADPLAGLVAFAIAVAAALWCSKSVMAVRLGWAATQGTVDPEGFARRVRRYRIVSWVCTAVLAFAVGTANDDASLLVRVSVIAVGLPLLVVWPELLGRFVRRMRREADRAAPFVADPNRGLVVGGYMLLGTAVLALVGTQLDWIPVVGMVAAAVHPGRVAALVYGSFAGWAAIEAIRETPRARLAVALFGAFSLIYLPTAALLLALGVATPIESVGHVASYSVKVTGSMTWLSPLLPTLLLTYIALGRERVRP